MTRARLQNAGVWMITTAIVTASAAAAYLARAPMYGALVSGVDSAGRSAAATPMPPQTLAEVNGSRVYATLALPVFLALLPLLVRGRLGRPLATWISALLLTGFCMLGALTIGMFYVPTAVALLAAAVVTSIGAVEGREGG